MKVIGSIFVILLTLVLLSWIVFFSTPKQADGSQKKSDIHKSNVINLRFGHNTPQDSALHQAALRFADEVKRKTDGKVTVTVFPSQQLGNDHKMVEMARNGDLDILLTPTAKMSVAVPSMQYADLPFYFPSRADVYEMLDGEPGKMILDELKNIGLVGATFWENGFKHITANTPILSPDDLKGKKIRVMKSRIIMDQFRAFGAKPIPIDFYETKQALADKVVDGEENPLIAIVSMGFYEVQSDLTLSEHAFLGYVLSFSEKVFSKLPQNIRMILMDTAKEVTPWERQETQRREKKLLEVIEKAGVHIHRLSEEQRREFAKLTQDIPEKFEETIGANIISKTKELLYEKYGAFLDNKEHVLIGIDADMSLGGKVAGLAIKRGVELAVSEINANGGLLGKPIEVIVKDHRTVSSKGVQNIKEFNDNVNLVAIIGGVHSAVIADEIDLIQKSKIPYIIPWAAAAQIVENGYKENYIFRVSANDRLASKFILDYTMKTYKNPAILVENSIWGRSNIELMSERLAKSGMKAATEIIYNRGQNSFESEISKILASGADSIIMVADSIESTKILQELSKREILLPVISHWGIITGNFFEQNKMISAKVKLRFFQTFSFNNKLAYKNLANSYMKKYKKENIKDIKTPAGVAQAYDAVHLLALAVKQAGSLNRIKIKKALEHLPPYQGVVKNYSPAFSIENHDALDENDYYMAKFNSDGLIVPDTEK